MIDVIKPDSRIVVPFSCGAASAFAGPLALAQYGATLSDADRDAPGK